MSENTIDAALHRLGYGGDAMTGHGFPAIAGTLLNGSGKWNPDAIERALAHSAADRARAAHLQLAQLHDVQRICSYVLAPATPPGV